jgi:hypothetical protein
MNLHCNACPANLLFISQPPIIGGLVGPLTQILGARTPRAAIEVGAYDHFYRLGGYRFLYTTKNYGVARAVYQRPAFSVWHTLMRIFNTFACWLRRCCTPTLARPLRCCTAFERNWEIF